MIRPTTQVFGLLTADADDGWLARLYNALFGFNGLDAAYVVFMVQPPHVGRVLDGLLSGGRAHHVHVGPSLWRPAARAIGSSLPFVDAVNGRGARFEHASRLVRFAAPLKPALFEPARGPDDEALQQVLLECGLTRGSGVLGFDTSFPGEPLVPPDAPPADVWSVTSWGLEPSHRRAWPESTLLGPPFTQWVRRAGDEVLARFGVEPRVPNDLANALLEPAFRPCQLTDDAFRAAYPHLEATP
ncbi:MAG: hypothetical protein JNM69_06890 [Archangium sp.]|nr:hypothetical protein [Archangium sp.]